MIQITIKENSEAAQAFLAFAKTLKFLKIEEVKEDSYDPKFVKKVLKSAASKNRTTVTAANLWDSI